jgi:hypothetical protein
MGWAPSSLRSCALRPSPAPRAHAPAPPPNGAPTSRGSKASALTSMKARPSSSSCRGHDSHDHTCRGEGRRAVVGGRGDGVPAPGLGSEWARNPPAWQHACLGLAKHTQTQAPPTPGCRASSTTRFLAAATSPHSSAHSSPKSTSSARRCTGVRCLRRAGRGTGAGTWGWARCAPARRGRGSQPPRRCLAARAPARPAHAPPPVNPLLGPRDEDGVGVGQRAAVGGRQVARAQQLRRGAGRGARGRAGGQQAGIWRLAPAELGQFGGERCLC